jgi:hypothetical protein
MLLLRSLAAAGFILFDVFNGDAVAIVFHLQDGADLSEKPRS